MMQGSWDDVTPRYDEMPIYVPSLKGFLSFGTFILYRDESSEEVVVGRLMHREANSNDTVVVNHFPLLASIPEMNKCVPHLASELTDSVSEIVHSRKLSCVALEDINNVAFVFKMEAILHQGIVLNGICNGYIIRFREDESPVEEFVTFPSRHKLHNHSSTCYSQQLWQSLEMIRDVLVRCLNRYSQKQGDDVRFSYKCPFFPSEAWHHISICCAHDSLSPRPVDTRSIRSRQFGPMKSSSFRMERSAELIRFETVQDLEIFRSIFGIHSTYGI